MSMTPTNGTFRAPSRFAPPARPTAPTPDLRSARPPLMRRYEVVHLDKDGEITELRRVAPAVPAFESAFSAFARGAPIPTDRGFIAVEDLLPGDRVRTVDHGLKPLLWKGCATLVPGTTGQSPEMGHLTRINAESFGFNRPASDIVFGPAAHFYHRTPGTRSLTGQDGAMIPLRDFVDGVNVVELTPMSAVPVYHLAFAAQERINIGGLEVETYHPGSVSAFHLRGDVLNLFLSLFPHRRSLEDFGAPAFRRLRLSDLDNSSAA